MAEPVEIIAKHVQALDALIQRVKDEGTEGGMTPEELLARLQARRDEAQLALEAERAKLKRQATRSKQRTKK